MIQIIQMIRYTSDIFDCRKGIEKFDSSVGHTYICRKSSSVVFFVNTESVSVTSVVQRHFYLNSQEKARGDHY